MKAHVLATKIGGILTDNKFDRFVGGKTRGKLDFSALAKIGYSDKVFKKREARKNKDYKVIVLADASGSMYGDRANNTGEALELLNDALQKTDVQYALWSFNGDILSLKDFEEKPKRSGETDSLYHKHLEDRYLHYCRACNASFGSFEYEEEEVDCPSCGKHPDTSTDCSNYNADGLALHLALEAVQKLSGEHIIVVLSDGQADCIPYFDSKLAYMVKDGIRYRDMKLGLVARKAIHEGVVLCSIGIQSEAVLSHYPKENTIVVQRTSQIGDALIKLISKHIKRG